MNERTSVATDSAQTHGPGGTETFPGRLSWPALINALLAFRGHIGHLLGFSFAINLLVLAVPVFMIQVFDRVLASHSMETLTVLAIGAVAALIVMAALDLIRGRILARAALQLEHSLGPELIAGGQQARLGDITTIRGFLSGPMMAAVLDAPWVPAFLLVVFLLHPLLGWIAVGGTVVLCAMAIAVERLTRANHITLRKADREVAAIVAQLKDSDGTMQVLGLRSKLRKRWHAAQSRATAARLRHIDRRHSAAVAARFLRLALQIALMAAAAALVIGGDITPGAMVAASIIASRAFGPVERAQEVWRSLIEARAALSRLTRTPARAAPRPSGFPIAGTPILEVRGVCVADPHGRAPLLRNVAFKVTGGEMIGITGPTGSGKSALARVIVGLEAPAAGRVTLDRQNMSQITLEQARDDIAYLSQTPDLIDGSISDNISRFGDAELPDVDTAARLAGIEDAILDLPWGYATEIGPAQPPLPRGLVQGILLARTFYASPRMIVMDEPYTYLDNNGIAHLLGSLEHFRELGSAVVIVSQRPSVLAHCDRVVVLEAGRSRVVGRKHKAQLRVLDKQKQAVDSVMKPAGDDADVRG